MSTNESTEGIYHVRISSEDVLSFAERHQIATYGSGKELTQQRNSFNHVINHAVGTYAENLSLAGGNNLNDKRWYVPFSTPNVFQNN